MTKLFLIFLLFTNFVFATSKLHREIETDLYIAEPIYTGEQGLSHVSKLLKQNFNISDSELNRINHQNSARIAKMHEYDVTLAKYKFVVLSEAIKKNPDHKKLELLYEQMNDIRAEKKRMWVTIKKSIWSIMDVNYPKRSQAERDKDTMGSLRW